MLARTRCIHSAEKLIHASLLLIWQNMKALVIGINAYKFKHKLKNAVRDARAFRDMLTEKGVQVIYGEDVTIEEFRALEKQYEDALQKDDIGIVFFAGHANTYLNATHLMTIAESECKITDHAINVYRLNLRFGSTKSCLTVRVQNCS